MSGKSKYDAAKVEKKWMEKWEKHPELNRAVDFDKKRDKHYLLVEFPYPSGEGLHMGHCRPYTCIDSVARWMRMNGKNVMFPMGWDAFGLPAENYAIKMKKHPSETVAANCAHFKEQMIRLAYSFDWEREVNTTDPKYYRWSQWIFLQLYKKGLAYKEEMPINWCPSCKIGLANEEVVDGKCERCGEPVKKRELSQWLLKITEYADRLLEDLEEVDYLPRIKAQQVNWIGRKEWIDISYPVDGHEDEEIVVSTTRPDTNFGSTFVVLAPEHPLLLKEKGMVPKEYRKDVDAYIDQAANKSELDRISEGKEKTGVFTGLYCVNRIDGRKLPIWVTDFVLMTVGTGAVVGVPGHDIRDFDFAKKYDLPIIRVVVGSDGDTSEITKREQVQEEEGKMINSEFLDGMDIHDATQKMMDHVEEKGWGKRTTRYHLRDWIFSRQHYWGEPIPIVFCDKCGEVPVPEDQLPIELPMVKAYEPTETGESPLANIEDWVNTKCPKCGGPARRETDTMPNWAGSNWYFLRYVDPENDKELADKKKLKYWTPVDWYNGGMEHTTLHLLYSRFWHKFLYDIGVVPTKEPYAKRTSHGVVLGPDGVRMSKSRGNVIVPDEVISKHGADTLRTYILFMGPFEGTIAWDPKGVEGCRRFLDRYWRFVSGNIEGKGKQTPEMEGALNSLIAKINEGLPNRRFNTVIAGFMEFVNAIEGKKADKEFVSKMVRILAPFAPYMAEELWEALGEEFSVHQQSWPAVDEKSLKQDKVTLPIQVNGKLRATVELAIDAKEADVKKEVMAQKNVKNHIGDKEPKKFLYVPGKIVNIVV